MAQGMYRSRKIQAFAPSKRMRSRSVSVAPRSKRVPRRALVKSNYARALISSSGVGLGPSLKTTLKTVYFTTVNASASGFYSGTVKSGSCFDPTGSFSTVQPSEFDQLAAVYGRYVVLGGYVKISIMNSSGSGGFACCMYPSIEATPKTDFQSCASQDFSVVKTGGGLGSTNGSVLYQRFSHAALLGKKGAVSSEDNGALVSADPAAGQFGLHHVCIQYSNAQAVALSVMLEIVQDVYFDRRINVTDV